MKNSIDELVEYLERSLAACDRPDYMCSVHAQAVDEILTILGKLKEKWEPKLPRIKE